MDVREWQPPARTPAPASLVALVGVLRSGHGDLYVWHSTTNSFIRLLIHAEIIREGFS
jgi:hypothetical protein